jgi:hypothetical protein
MKKYITFDKMKIIERIKCYLRANKYYKKYLQTDVNNMRYFMRSCKYYAKYYSFKKDRKITGKTLYFIIDPNIKHPGLCDRYKAIVGCYYIALQNGFDFKIIFDYPFRLRDYLDINEHDWIAERNDLSYSLRNSRVIPYNGGGKPPCLNKSINQYHVYNYIGYDILETNHIPDYKIIWGKLYNRLFTSKSFINRLIDETGFKKNDYIAIHLRFVNALEHFEGDHFNELAEDNKEILINRCLKGITNIIGENTGKQVIVFSDSKIFLDRVKELPVYVLDGKIGHISFENDKEIIIKTFIDFYMISNAERIYMIKAPEMYASVFSYYAALAGFKNMKILEV